MENVTSRQPASGQPDAWLKFNRPRKSSKTLVGVRTSLLHSIDNLLQDSGFNWVERAVIRRRVPLIVAATDQHGDWLFLQQSLKSNDRVLAVGVNLVPRRVDRLFIISRDDFNSGPYLIFSDEPTSNYVLAAKYEVDQGEAKSFILSFAEKERVKMRATGISSESDDLPTT
jgi:hypothetical protein